MIPLSVSTYLPIRMMIMQLDIIQFYAKTLGTIRILPRLIMLLFPGGFRLILVIALMTRVFQMVRIAFRIILQKNAPQKVVAL